MKIERIDGKIVDSDVFYVEPRGEHPVASAGSKSRFRRIVPYIITAITVAAITTGVVKYESPKHFDLQFALQATSGKIALTQQQLHDVVVGEGLRVYWLGPENGALYVLNSVSETQNYVRYLPGGAGLNDVGANFRVVGTYEAKDAFLITQTDVKSANGSGFTNTDGNAVYYNTTHPLSVYVGVKDSNDQIEIFDPTVGQALIAARARGLIQRIK